MRRKVKKQKKVKVAAGKKKDGFEAEEEEEDVSILVQPSLLFSMGRIKIINLLMI